MSAYQVIININIFKQIIININIIEMPLALVHWVISLAETFKTLVLKTDKNTI